MKSNKTKVRIESAKHGSLIERNLWHYNSILNPQRAWSNSGITYESGSTQITEESVVKFLYSQYKILIYIDLSPSIFSYHPQLKDTLVNTITPTLQKVLSKLKSISESKGVNIEIGMLLAGLAGKPLKVVAMNHLINSQDSVNQVIDLLSYHLSLLQMSRHSHLTESGIEMATALKWCIFSLYSMKTQAKPSVIFVTDGVNCNFELGIYDGLVMQYCRADVNFHVISLAEDLEPHSLEFGYVPDSSGLELVARSTGGLFLTRSDLGNLEDLLYIESCLNCSSTLNIATSGSSIEEEIDRVNKYAIDEYLLELPLEIILKCRLREGFKIFEANSERVCLRFDAHFNTKLEYVAVPKDPGSCKIQLSLISRHSLYEKLLKLNFSTSVNSGSKPNSAQRITWVITKAKETEGIALELWQATSGKVSLKKIAEKVSNLQISKWHRWFDMQRLDIVISKSKQENLIQQGKDRLKDKFKQLGKGLLVKNTYVELIDSLSLICAKVEWEGDNKITCYFGFFQCSNEFMVTKKQEVINHFTNGTQLEVYTRPLGKLLVENLSHEKYNVSRVYSIFNYKPHVQAIRAFMHSYSVSKKLCSKKSASMLLSILYQLRLRSGFYYLGESESSKYVLVKNIEVKGQTHFIQYLIYQENLEVHSNLYLEPGIASALDKSEEKVLSDFTEEFQSFDNFLYECFATLDFLVYKSLQKKLNDEDLQPDEISQENTGISEDDDLYCYFETEELSQCSNYEELKLEYFEKFYSFLEKLEETDFEPKLDSLLQTGVSYFLELEFFDMVSLGKSDCIFETLSKNIHKAFRGVSDYNLKFRGNQYYVRFVCEEAVLLWKLPDLTNASKKVDLEICECDYSRIDIQLTLGRRKSFISALDSKSQNTLTKTLTLIQRVYKQSLYSTCYNSLREGSIILNSDDLLAFISNCDKLSLTFKVDKLIELLRTNWERVEELTAGLIQKAVYSNSHICKAMDLHFSKLLEKHFEKIGGTEYFMYRDTSQKFFFRMGKNLTRLSQHLYHTELEYTIYTFHYPSYFYKEWKTHNCVPKYLVTQNRQHEEGVLKTVVKEAKSLLAERTLELLTDCLPLDESVLKQVHLCFKQIKKIKRSKHPLEFIVKNQDYSSLLHKELAKNYIINLRRVGDYYVVVNSKYNKSIFFKEEYESDVCYLEEVDEDPDSYWVPFWMVIGVKKNTLVFQYFLPDYLKYKQLNDSEMDQKIKEWCKSIEARISQNILLKQLLDTGNISQILLPPSHSTLNESSQTFVKESRERIKKKYVRNSSSRIQESKQEKLNPPKAPFTLNLHHVNYFIISDRLQKDEAKNALDSKFSIPPFLIYNNDEFYMLPQDNETYVFRFFEGNKQKDSKFPSISKNMDKLAEKNPYKVRVVNLEIYGIDPPSKETISKLEQTVQEQLQQISLFKLADSLVKNQKSIMTYNDAQFIQGNQPPLIQMYSIPNSITNLPLLLSYLKQNLARFLFSFKIKEVEETALVYNYLKLVGVPTSKQTKPSDSRKKATVLAKQSHSKTEDSVPFLGNTFGKALALIYLGRVYFNGESIEESEDLFQEDEWILPETIESLKRHQVIGIGSPANPGYYLEIKIYKNGPLNESAFIDYLNQCVKQVMSEYFLEAIFSYSLKTNFPSDVLYSQIAEYSRIAVHNSLENHVHSISHYAPPFTLFSFYSKIVSAARKALNYIDTVYCLESNNQKLLTDSMQQTQKLWNQNCDEVEYIGNNIKLSAMMGPLIVNKIINEMPIFKQTNDLKLYQSNAQEDITRSLFVSIEITKTNIEVLSYNLNRAVLLKLHKKVQKQVSLAKADYRILNNGLTQKLGLYHHNVTMSSDICSRNSFQKEQISNLLPRACNTFQIKDEKKSLEDTFELGEEEGLRNFKLQGMWPMIKYNIPTQHNRSKVAMHGGFLRDMLTVKHGLLDDCMKVSKAYKKWCSEKQGNVNNIISQVLPRNTLSTNDLVTAHDIIQLAQVVKIDKAVIQFVPSKKSFKEPEDKQKMTNTISTFIKVYANELKKLTKLDILTKEDHMSSTSNILHEHSPQTSQSSLRKGSSSGNIDHKRENMQFYLKKAFEQSIFLVEISYEEPHITTTAYCIENIQKFFPSYQWEESYPNQNLKKEIHRLKSSIKTPVFIYDIQIKHLCIFLCRPRDYPAIDLLATLNCINRLSPKSPPGASNSLYVGILCIDLGELNGVSVEEIYKYFLLNSDEYNFQSYPYKGETEAVYTVTNPSEDISSSELLKNSISTEDIKFLNSLRGVVYTKVQHNEKSHRTRPVVSLESTQTENKLRIAYYIINYEKQRKGPKETIKAIKSKAEEDVVEAIRKSKGHYRRDRLWHKLERASESESFSFEEFRHLLAASEVQCMQEIDLRIKDITSLSNIFNSECFDYLKLVYGHKCKRFAKPAEWHLVVFYSPKILAHLETSSEGDLKLNLVKKSPETKKDEEDEFITDLVSKILQWLWASLNSAINN